MVSKGSDVQFPQLGGEYRRVLCVQLVIFTETTHIHHKHFLYLCYIL